MTISLNQLLCIGSNYNIDYKIPFIDDFVVIPLKPRVRRLFFSS